MSENSIDQYGPFAYLFLVIFCTLLFFVGQCGSCLGIDYWRLDTKEETRQKEEAEEARYECQTQCGISYPDTWKEPDFTLQSKCTDAC